MRSFAHARFITALRFFLVPGLCATALLASEPYTLRVATGTNSVRLSWSTNAGHYVLETTDRLEPDGVWWPARFATSIGADVSVALHPVANPRFFRLATNDYSAWIATVQGPVDATGTGLILPHEHIFTDLRGPTAPGYGEADPDEVVRLMKPNLVEAREQGVDILVECSSIGVGRNVSVIRRLAEESGLRIVVPTGVYGRDQFAPPAHRAMTEDQLAELFRDEIAQEIEGTGIQAGFIKIATGGGTLTALEEKILRAAGRAARETGAVIASHTPVGSAARRQMDILESISPAIRFIWVHAQAETNRRLHRELAVRGAFIEFDSIGWNPGDDNTLITAIGELIAAGHADRILLSHDAGWYDPARPGVGPQKPYTYLLGTFVPKLRTRGLDEETIRMLTIDNPRRAFAFIARTSF